MHAHHSSLSLSKASQQFTPTHVTGRAGLRRPCTLTPQAAAAGSTPTQVARSWCLASAQPGSKARRRASLACQAISSSSSSSADGSSSEEAAAAPSSQQERQQQQQQHAQPGSEHHQQRHDSAQQEVQAHQQQQYSPEQQLLKAAMKRLQALEAYQQLLADSSGPADKQLQREAGDTPSVVSAKIAADRDEVPLLEASIMIAQHAYPDLDPAVVRQQLDDLAAEVEAGLPEGVRYPLRVIREINRVLYQVHGFKGNSEDYYNPDNSCINRVLETKQGIPISLSLVYMEVAQRVGLPMAGVNLPAHFMIRPKVEGMEWLVDAFNGGELTALEDAEEVLGKLMGAQVKLDPRFVSGDTPPLSCRAFLLRLLNNLKQIYITLNMAEEALTIVRYMRATAPAGSLPELQRDEGLCLYGLGRWAEASDVLQCFMATTPDQRDAALVAGLLDKIKERAAAAAAAAAAAGGAKGSSSSGVCEDEQL